MERPLERRTAARTAVVWDAVRALLDGQGSRARGSSRSSTSVAAPAASRSGWRPSATRSPSSTPAPTPSPRWPAGPTRRTWPTGSPASRATSAPCATWCPELVDQGVRPGAVPRRTRPRRRPRRRAGTRSPRCCDPAAPSRCWSASATPPCSPGRWPVTSPRPRACSRVTSELPSTDQRSSERRFTADEVTGLLEGPGSPSAAATASASSPTWCPRPCSTSSPAPAAALLELERAVADRPEYLTLASPAPRPRHSLTPVPRWCPAGLVGGASCRGRLGDSDGTASGTRRGARGKAGASGARQRDRPPPAHLVGPPDDRS